MSRPDPQTLPPYYRKYVDYVMDLDLPDALKKADRLTQELLQSVPETKGNFRYAEGKWSIKEVLNHIMDAERVFAYRALRFSRNDQTPLPSFEENEYAGQANADSRTIKQLAAEMHRLRETSIDLFASCTTEMLRRTGTASNNKISVINLGYIIAGHDLHHRSILLERYLNG
ncbi:MAG TPA: DinB family protein [Chryseosolibacter sp.]